MSDRPPMWLGWTALAAHAGVSADTLRRWSRLPGFPEIYYPTSRRPRIRVAAFDAWLEAQQARPGAPGVDVILAELRAARKGA